MNNEEPKNSINYVLMDINTLAYENRDHCATGVRAISTPCRRNSSSRT